MKRRFQTHTLVALLAVAGALGAPEMASAQAPCARWDVSQGWYAIQGKTHVQFQLRQRGTSLEGTASYLPGTNSFWGPGIAFFIPMTSFRSAVDGDITGTLQADSIEVNTPWGGVYVGTIDVTGRIDGYTYDKRDSNSRATWYSDRRMNCLARVGASTAPPVAPPPMQPMPLPDRSSGLFTPTRGSLAASVFAGTRPAPAPAPAPLPAPAASPAPPASIFGASCKHGYVRRGARATDLVCVTPASRARVAAENRSRAARIQPGGGFYGPNTCRVGFVWREAYVGDLVCVTPVVRAFVRQENQLAAARVNPTRKS